MLYVVMVVVAPFVPFTPGMSGFLMTCMVFTGGSLIPLMC